MSLLKLDFSKKLCFEISYRSRGFLYFSLVSQTVYNKTDYSNNKTILNIR